MVVSVNRLTMPPAVNPNATPVPLTEPAVDVVVESIPGVARLRWVYVSLLLLVGIVNYIDRQTLSVLAVTIQGELHLSTIQYGYVVQSFLITYMVMYTVSGRLVDRYRPKRTQAAFLFLWSLAGILTGFASGFAMLVLCRALLGAAEPGNYTASLRAVGDWFSAKQRALAVGIYSMGGTLGAAIAVPLTAVIALRYGWRSSFFIPGIAGFVALALWLLLYRDPPAAQQRTVRPPWRSVLGARYLPELVFTRILTDSVWYFFLFWIPKYMQDSQHMRLSVVGKTVWVLFVAADIGSLAGGAWSSHLVARRGPVLSRLGVMVAAACGMISLVAVPRLGHVSSAIGVLSALALLHMAWMSNATTLTLDLYPQTMVGTLQGFIGSASALGGLISAGLIGWTVERHGYRPVFACLALLHPISALILWTRLRHASPAQSTAFPEGQTA